MHLNIGEIVAHLIPDIVLTPGVAATLDGLTGRPRRKPLARYSAIEGALRSRPCLRNGGRLSN
jgi:hypothetical protein